MDVSSPRSIGIDVVAILVTGVIFQVLKKICRGNLYPRIPRAILSTEDPEYDKKVFQFSKQLWGFTWHFSNFVLELAVLVPEDFWPAVYNPYGGTELLWTYDPGELPSLGIRSLYLVQIGYYTVELVYNTLIERPGDFKVSLVHHLVALSLLWMSYTPTGLDDVRLWKIGAAILFTQECGDVTLYASKCFHYLNMKNVSTTIFIVNIGVWIITRILYYIRIIIGFLLESNVDLLSIWQTIPCIMLLSVLFLLHIYWVFLMCRIIYRSVVKGEKVEDKRDRIAPSSRADV